MNANEIVFERGAIIYSDDVGEMDILENHASCCCLSGV